MDSALSGLLPEWITPRSGKTKNAGKKYKHNGNHQQERI